jgi:hypothetical protein
LVFLLHLPDLLAVGVGSAKLPILAYPDTQDTLPHVTLAWAMSCHGQFSGVVCESSCREGNEATGQLGRRSVASGVSRQ